LNGTELVTGRQICLLVKLGHEPVEEESIYLRFGLFIPESGQFLHRQVVLFFIDAAGTGRDKRNENQGEGEQDKYNNFFHRYSLLTDGVSEAMLSLPATGSIIIGQPETVNSRRIDLR